MHNEINEKFEEDFQVRKEFWYAIPPSKTPYDKLEHMGNVLFADN